jgi:hypothetical protein
MSLKPECGRLHVALAARGSALLMWRRTSAASRSRPEQEAADGDDTIEQHGDQEPATRFRVERTATAAIRPRVDESRTAERRFRIAIDHREERDGARADVPRRARLAALPHDTSRQVDPQSG